VGGAAKSLIQADPRAEVWLAVETRCRFEKKVAAQLSSKGIHVFLPLRRETRVWCDREKNVSVPLFPGYAFVRSNRLLVPRLLILQTAGVVGFASLAGAVATMPQKQIDNLQLVLAHEVPFSMCPFVQVGQRVRIRGGCLDGLEGLLPQHEKGNLVISVEPIQRSLAVEIQGYAVEFI